MLLLVVLLEIGLCLFGLAVIAAGAAVLVREPRIGKATSRALTARHWASVDPNEAARAAGSWG